MRKTRLSLKSTKGFHVVRFGRGSWVFDTLDDAMQFISARY